MIIVPFHTEYRKINFKTIIVLDIVESCYILMISIEWFGGKYESGDIYTSWKSKVI